MLAILTSGFPVKGLYSIAVSRRALGRAALCQHLSPVDLERRFTTLSLRYDVSDQL